MSDKESHRRRLLEECGQLAERCDKLEAFLLGPMYQTLSQDDRRLLAKQFGAMTEYHAILNARISLARQQTTTTEPFRQRTNDRGFQDVTIEDTRGGHCNVQQSSAIDDTERGMNNPGSSYLWLDVNGVEPRAHMDREQVQELVGVLKKWLATGQLFANGDAA